MPKKFERCVKEVKKKQPNVNPYAICKFSMKKKGGHKKVEIAKQPIRVKVEPEPLPPPPTKAEIKAQEKAEKEAKLQADREERYQRNLKYNDKVTQQGIIAGKGVKEDGSWDYEIEDIMNKYPEFKGVIAADEIHTLPADKKVAFIMNTAKRSEPGEHWVSCLIDTRPHVRSVEYFDSFGHDGSSRFKRDIKMLVDKINPETYLLYKHNKVKQQDASTNTCGLHAMNFLMKRLRGRSFIEATGYKPGQKKDQSKKYEREVNSKFSEMM